MDRLRLYSPGHLWTDKRHGHLRTDKSHGRLWTDLDFLATYGPTYPENPKQPGWLGGPCKDTVGAAHGGNPRTYVVPTRGGGPLQGYRVLFGAGQSEGSPGILSDLGPSCCLNVGGAPSLRLTGLGLFGGREGA